MASSSSSHRNNDNDTIIPPKPPRPFTEYHIFSQLERNYILQNPSNNNTDDDSKNKNNNSKEDKKEVDTTVTFTDIDPNASARPPKYRNLILPNQWHSKGSRPKCRSHRKNHGKITFVEMTKLISKRWREADSITKCYCRDLSVRELKRYREEMKDYVDRYGAEAGRTKSKTKGGGGSGGKGGNKKSSNGKTTKSVGGGGGGGDNNETMSMTSLLKSKEDLLVQENAEAGSSKGEKGKAKEMANDNNVDKYKPSSSSFQDKKKNASQDKKGREKQHEEDELVRENINMLLRRQAEILAASSDALHVSMAHHLLYNTIPTTMTTRMKHHHHGFRTSYNNVPSSSSINPYYRYRPLREVFPGPMLLQPQMAELPPGGCWPFPRDDAAANHWPSSSSRDDAAAAKCWPSSQPSPHNAHPAPDAAAQTTSPPFSPRSSSSSSSPSVDEGEDEDELGALLYQFSRTAKARAAGAKREADDAFSSSNIGDISIPQNNTNHHHNSNNPLPCPHTVSSSSDIGDTFSNESTTIVGPAAALRR